MKFLLAAINAKYIHSNPGVYSLMRYAGEKLNSGLSKRDGNRRWEIEIGEYTINHQMDAVLRDIYEKAPDAVGFSCYIWNILYIEELVRDLKKVLPHTEIWLGGPEVSYRAEEILKKEPSVRGIMTGEGEETFYRLLKSALENPASEKRGGAANGGSLWSDRALLHIPGLVFRKLEKGQERENSGLLSEEGKDMRGGDEIAKTGPAPLMDLSEIPFVYENLEGFEHRIIYYESSRGCPFSCSYCLSSIDKSVRFRDMGLVKRELEFFLKNRVPQVKFVDRTFNCKKSRSMEIWRFIHDHDNGITNFHFEISADLLSEEELALLSEMRPGLVQLEIGVQTVNPGTIREIRRHMDLDRLRKNVERINSFQNIHQHLDLIAGLPYEDFDSFKNSFNQVYAMEPEQLQLGFLKVLSGSYMEEAAESYGLLYRSTPPYEVLSTRWLSYRELIRLKESEEMVEIYYNSGQFRNTLKALAGEFDSPFDMFLALSVYYKENGLSGISHSRIARYEILLHFIETVTGGNGKLLEEYRDLLAVDLYLRENVKNRPAFLRSQSFFKDAVKNFFIEEGKKRRFLKGYEEYDSRQMGNMAHVEVLRDGTMLLFDYLHRDALFGNAATFAAGRVNKKGEYERESEETGRNERKVYIKGEN